MSNLIEISCVVSNPTRTPPRAGTALVINVSKFIGRTPPLNIPELVYLFSLPQIPFTGSSTFKFGVGDTGIVYWFDAEVDPGNGGNVFVGSWNDTHDVAFVNPGPITLTAGGTTPVNIGGSVVVHQRPQ